MRKRIDDEKVEKTVGNNARNIKKKPEIRWEKLDNTAHLFPVIAGERTSNVFRISVTLKEPVDGKLLQKALDTLLPKFDSFNLRLRRGVFWHYFEENGKSAPRVTEEKGYPCRFIRDNKNNSYLFKVTYYKYRINLEVFHVLTDGMGAVGFLKELTYGYLRLLHPSLAELTCEGLDSSTTLNREDSFLKNYKRSNKAVYKSKRAYLFKGEKFRNGELGVMHGYMNIPELKKVCKQYDVSINEYLVSAYIWSIYTECLHMMPSKQPIRVAVPVNLRPYFNSITTKNFFVMISAEFHPVKENYTFSEVLTLVRESLREQLTPEHLEKIFSYNVSNQQNVLLRLVPLPLKSVAINHVYTRSALANTSTITNLGKIEVLEPYKEYIEQFHAIIALSKGQHLKGTVCSFGETLVFTFSYDLADVSLQRGFFRRLAEDGMHIELESNGVSYG